MIYVYAILDASACGDEGPQIHEACHPEPERRISTARGTTTVEILRSAQDDNVTGAVALHRVDAIAAAYAEVDEAPSRSAQQVWHHEHVIEALMQRHTLLPCRFGTMFQNLADLDELLRRHAKVLASALENVRGHVELGLRVMGALPRLEPNRVPAPSSGREYLLHRMTQERQRHEAERVADEIESPLLGLCRSHTRRVLPGSGVLLAASYLVPTDGVEAFRRTIGETGDRHPHVRVLCTGPWPPYNFVPQLQNAEEPHVASV
jgi:hypothetical protein